MPLLDLLPKNLIHQPMLLNHTQTRKFLAHDVDAVHATAAAGDVLDFEFGRGKAFFDEGEDFAFAFGEVVGWFDGFGGI